MTVGELIEILESIEDKDKIVFLKYNTDIHYIEGWADVQNNIIIY